MTKQNKHAVLSPSSAHCWLNCYSSVELSKDLPDTSSAYADEGTCAHALAERALTHNKDAKFFIGERIVFGETVMVVDEEVAGYIQVHLDYVRREGEGKSMLFEQGLPLTPLTGEEGARGTADVVIFGTDTLHVVDLKFGRGEEVDATDNEQLMLYAAAAREEYAVLGDFDKFKVSIVQPRLDHIDAFEFTSKELDAFVFKVKQVSTAIRFGEVLFCPEDSVCRWCRAKAICPALTKKVIDATSSGFSDLDAVAAVDLSKSMALTDTVEDWSRAVRAEVERRLVSGVPVAGFKLVKGRMGARQWDNPDAVEEILRKQMRYPLETIYKMSLHSPTQIEKKIAKDHPKHWAALQDKVVRKEGAPSVAPESDERPALEVGSGFEVLA